jgi:hypothetical protein
MPQIIRHLPTFVKVLQTSTIFQENPGLQIGARGWAPTQARYWGGFEAREYDLATGPLTQAQLSEFHAVLDQIGGGLVAITEGESVFHRELLCGPGIADGSRTTFTVPLVSGSSVTPFQDGVPMSTGYTFHASANLIPSDGMADGSDATLLNSAGATDTDASGFALEGLESVKVSPTGGANVRQWIAGIQIPVTAAEEYTGQAWVRLTNASAQNYRLILWWYESDQTYITNSNSGDFSLDAADGWAALFQTVTAPALAAWVLIDVQRNDTSGTDPFYVDCYSVAPGDCESWHLPSVAPGLLEFDTAPAEGTVISANGTGKRWARCHLEDPTWTMDPGGRVRLSNLRATEALEWRR